MESDLLDQMCALLMRHCGEKGDNEGAYETLERIIKERDRLEAMIFNVGTKEALDLLEEIWTSIPTDFSGPQAELHALILNKIPMVLHKYQYRMA